MSTIYRVVLLGIGIAPIEQEFAGDDALDHANAAYAEGRNTYGKGHIVAIDSETEEVTRINSFDDDYLFWEGYGVEDDEGYDDEEDYE